MSTFGVDPHKGNPVLIGTPRAFTTDPNITDAHLAAAIREIARTKDVTQIFQLAAVYSAKEQSNG